MNTESKKELKVKVEWTYKEPNTIKANSILVFTINNESKVDLINQVEKDYAETLIKLWSKQVIKMTYPKTCELYEPIVLNVEF